MRYLYDCHDCLAAARAKLRREKLTKAEWQRRVHFETAHPMSPTPQELAEARVCPRCNGSNTNISLTYYNPIGFVRGNGILKDVKGLKREVNIHKLTGKDSDTGASLDPYLDMRPPGEAAELRAKMLRDTKPQAAKVKRDSCTAQEMEELVKEAAKTRLPEIEPE